MTRVFHVDEVDDDEAAGIAQAQLARDFDCGFEVGVERGVLDVRALGRFRGVDVDRGQRFGLIDHDRAARRQAHIALERVLDLRLDLIARKQRHRFLVQLELAQVVRHDLLHELARIVVQLGAVDQDFADVVAQVVAQGADDELGFLVDQERGRAAHARFGNRLPHLQQVIQIPLQFFRVTADAGGADDQAHFVGQGEFVEFFFQVGAVIALDAARHAAGARIVRHQHEVAAGERDERGQRGAFVAAFFLFDLNQQFLAFLEQFADTRAIVVDTALEILTRDFLHRQEAVAFGAVFDEAGFQRGFDPGDAAFVDIGLFLLFGGNLDVEIVERLAIDNGHAQLFTLSCVDQHAFHFYILTALYRLRVATHFAPTRENDGSDLRSVDRGLGYASTGALLAGAL